MNTNIHKIEQIIEYIEAHLLEEKLDLESIAQAIGYSKYYIHRMFTPIVGMPIHHYISRRRLSVAARLLVQTQQPIIEIALMSGYESQRAFNKSFKRLYKQSPLTYRHNQEWLPLQLKFAITQYQPLCLKPILDIRKVESDPIYLVGYQTNTKWGFHVIGKIWHQLHRHLTIITDRCDPNFLVAINDYAHFYETDKHPVFTYFAGAEVSSLNSIPKGMKSCTLSKTTYLIFSFNGRNQESVEPLINTIYHDWFAQTDCQISDKYQYDIIKYGETIDESGRSPIEIWVPID